MFAAPAGGLFYLSRLEQARYEPPAVDGSVVLVERAYGGVTRVEQVDLKESICLSGQVVSTARSYQELPDAGEGQLRLWVQPGDYLAEGDPIGTCRGETVLAAAGGVVSKVSLEGEAYLELYDPGALALECYVTEDLRRVLSRDSLALTDSGGAAYEVLRLDAVPTRNGQYRVRLRAADGVLTYGTACNNKVMYTGRVYPGGIVVPESCVYTRDGQTWCVRLVDVNGVFLSEAVVELGARVGDLICVSGVLPGQYCDGGYKAVLESGGGL